MYAYSGEEQIYCQQKIRTPEEKPPQHFSVAKLQTTRDYLLTSPKSTSSRIYIYIIVEENIQSVIF